MREQLDDQTLKCKALSETNNGLSRTLMETQHELETLIIKHEKTVQELKVQEREFIEIKRQLKTKDEELTQRTQAYNDLRIKDINQSQ